ncbi:MAG: TonB-dependent receptor [Sphingomonas sp.]|uniref:TonB-dependent receptor domain-containing protein n=1 Tax=Sphingomonas sp. TaxID=28214 RepID=UPI001AC97B3D|nr:TonB-dependent receptor [Sphingomonas sp.]MBN8807979.1 TonB-dependent receptor [Sphingomonas sp.]
MTASTSLRHLLATGTALAALCALPTLAHAQTTGSDQTTPPASTPTGAATPDTGANIAADESKSDKNGDREIIVTGSRIKQDPNNSALPLQIITTQEIQRNGISSPEQLISFLAANGNGADNLASNSDVVTGAQRGTNGLSAANLRGQGSAATLILLNGRRVAAHGLQGSAVDVNQIPFAAIDRVEILKDGASAIYGTDAIGGVINFITKKNFKGLDLQGFTDVTEQGGGEIYRLSGTIGFGDLATQHWNVMGAVSKSWNTVLNGYDRAFVNGNQPNRGLSIDTRGTPIATIFPANPGSYMNQSGTLLGGTSGSTVLSGLLIPGTTTTATGGINLLNLPGGAGCQTMDGGMAYDYALWATPTARYACAWDTGRAAVIQQPLETLTYYGRGVVELGRHQIALEVTGSDATSAKRFSNAQVSVNTTTSQVGYPLNSLTAPTYNAVYNQLVALFPSIAANYGKPIAYRWRCVACGTREYVTNTKTFRLAASAEGPITGPWNYNVGASYARSEANSTLGNGYYYSGTKQDPTTKAYVVDTLAPTAPGASAPGLIGLLNSGLINPFSLTQSDAALAGLQAVSAKGVVLYGGKYEVRQADASVSGPLFKLPGGDAQLAVGVDYRRETYSFNGSPAAVAGQPTIFLAAFDNVNALTPKNRTVKAAYGEIQFPILPSLEINLAGRIDDYTGFGTTKNPKVSAKFKPFDWLMFRASYSTGFRVPTFNQIYNGVTESPYQGKDLVDPIKCPSLQVSTTDPNCAIIQPNVDTGGKSTLGPETSKQFTGGVVFTPSRHFSASADFWMINVDNTITILALKDLIGNAALFPDRFIRDSTGTIVTLDDTYINAGARRTQGIDFSAHGGFDALGGSFSAGLDGTLLLKKREKLVPNAPYGGSLIGVFTLTGDLGLKWKHDIFVNYANKDWSLTLTQIFRDGYKNQALPGIANGTVVRPDYNPRVANYIVYNASLSFIGIPGYKFTMGIRNLFNTDPPFAITYDSNSGAGSSWEPRVADPRGRSFNFNVEAKF